MEETGVYLAGTANQLYRDVSTSESWDVLGMADNQNLLEEVAKFVQEGKVVAIIYEGTDTEPGHVVRLTGEIAYNDTTSKEEVKIFGYSRTNGMKGQEEFLSEQIRSPAKLRRTIIAVYEGETKGKNENDDKNSGK
jgi:hypothetical protein